MLWYYQTLVYYAGISSNTATIGMTQSCDIAHVFLLLFVCVCVCVSLCVTIFLWHACPDALHAECQPRFRSLLFPRGFASPPCYTGVRQTLTFFTHIFLLCCHSHTELCCLFMLWSLLLSLHPQSVDFRGLLLGPFSAVKPFWLEDLLSFLAPALLSSGVCCYWFWLLLSDSRFYWSALVLFCFWTSGACCSPFRFMTSGACCFSAFGGGGRCHSFCY